MNQLLNNLDQLHTTELGVVRIKKNLGLADVIDAVQYCKEKSKIQRRSSKERWQS